MNRRKTVALVAIMIMILAGSCSTAKSTGSATTTLTLNQTGPEPTYVKNWNIFSPVSQKAPGPNFFYEPLIRLDVLNGATPQPWLAESWEIAEDGRSITFKLRTDVTFTDGEPLTSADVKFTFEVPGKNPKLGRAALPFKSIDTPDEHTVVINYEKPSFHDLASFASAQRNIVPKHIWAEQDLQTWTNPEPVGSGPYTLDSFSPQLVKLKVRDDYWGGDFKGVEYVALRAFGSEDSGREMLLQNELDWAPMSLQDPQENFESKCDCHYWGDVPGLADEGIMFQNQAPPTNNVHVRRALYLAIDPVKINSLYDTGQSMANPTGLSSVWNDFLPEGLRDQVHKANLEEAKAELAKSGYEIKEGVLSKGGKKYPLTIKTVAEYTNWKAYAPGLTQQWKEGLGLTVKPLALPEDQHYEQQTNGDFTIMYSALMAGNEIYKVLNNELNSELSQDEEALGNFSRFHNDEVDAQLAAMKGTDDPEQLKAPAQDIVQTVADEVPFGPLHAPGFYVEYNASRWTGWPDPKTANYTPHFGQGSPDITLTIQHLTPVN